MKKTRHCAIALALLACKPDTAELATSARDITQRFGAALKAELMKGMKQGGPPAAVEACSEKAPGIAQSLALEGGWQVRRTSLKTRNPDNAPDAWEQAALERFDKSVAEGTLASELEFFEIVDGEFRYLKAIPTEGVCLTCHGDQIAAEIVAALDKRYPDDKARGFHVGDVRGAFSVRKRL